MTVVREFHEAFGLDVSDYPTVPSPEVIRLRMRLIHEETKEVIEELEKLLYQLDPAMKQGTLGSLLKELADLRYVVEGCAVTMGLPIDDAYAEVHRSNMSKLGEDGQPIYDKGGKVLKGPGYEPADMTKFVDPVIDSEVVS
jgi:predicted HAD superfamily Cof-like phosphohydrolase